MSTSDGSEVKNGRNPLQKDDDVSLPWWWRVVRANSKVRISLPQTDSSWRTVVQKAASRAGSYQTVSELGGPIHDDDDSHSGARDPLGDEAIVISGLSEMQVSTDGQFEGAAWQPYSPEITLWLPALETTTLYARVRDAAGNESFEKRLTIQVVAKTSLDQALSIEELALDAMNQGQWAQAKSQLSASLPKLDASLDKVKKRIAAKGPPHPTDLKLLAGLLLVKAKKVEALALAKPVTGHLARKVLGAALELERDLATQAEQQGRSL